MYPVLWSPKQDKFISWLLPGKKHNWMVLFSPFNSPLSLATPPQVWVDLTASVAGKNPPVKTKVTQMATALYITPDWRKMYFSQYKLIYNWNLLSKPSLYRWKPFPDFPLCTRSSATSLPSPQTLAARPPCTWPTPCILHPYRKPCSLLLQSRLFPFTRLTPDQYVRP